MTRPVIKLIVLAALILLLATCLKPGSMKSVANMCPGDTALLLEVRDPLGAMELLGGSRFFEAYAASSAASARTQRFQSNLIDKREPMLMLSAVVKRVSVAVIWDDPRVVHPFDMGPPVVVFLDVGALRVPIKFIVTAMSKGGNVYGEPVRGHTVFNSAGFSVVFVGDQIAVGSQARVKSLLDVQDDMRPSLTDLKPDWDELRQWADTDADVTGFLLDGRILKVKQDNIPGLPIEAEDFVDLDALDGAVLNGYLKNEGPLITGVIRQQGGLSFLRLLDISKGEPKSKFYLSDGMFDAIIVRLANPTELSPMLMELLKKNFMPDVRDTPDVMNRPQALKMGLLETALTAMLAQIDHEIAMFTIGHEGPKVFFVLLEDVRSADLMVRTLARAAGSKDFQVPQDGEIGEIAVGENTVYMMLRGRKLLVSNDSQALLAVDRARNPQQQPRSIGATYEYVDPDGSFLALWDVRGILDAEGRFTGPDREFILDSWRGHLGIGFTVHPDRSEFAAYMPVDLELPQKPGWWKRQTLTWLHSVYFALKVAGWLLMILFLWLAMRQVRAIIRISRERSAEAR